MCEIYSSKGFFSHLKILFSCVFLVKLCDGQEEEKIVLRKWEYRSCEISLSLSVKSTDDQMSTTAQEVVCV